MKIRNSKFKIQNFRLPLLLATLFSLNAVQAEDNPPLTNPVQNFDLQA